MTRQPDQLLGDFLADRATAVSARTLARDERVITVLRTELRRVASAAAGVPRIPRNSRAATDLDWSALEQAAAVDLVLQAVTLLLARPPVRGDAPWTDTVVVTRHLGRWLAARPGADADAIRARLEWHPEQTPPSPGAPPVLRVVR